MDAPNEMERLHIASELLAALKEFYAAVDRLPDALLFFGGFPKRHAITHGKKHHRKSGGQMNAELRQNLIDVGLPSVVEVIEAQEAEIERLSDLLREFSEVD